jgi:hypothetical protein
MNKPLTRREAEEHEIQILCDSFAPVIRDYVLDAVRPLHDRIKVLEARPNLKYCGTWAADKVYGVGNFVTDGGSIWHAQRASIGERPGTSPADAWLLAVKKGKDAR